MDEKDIIRIVLIVLLLGYSLPGISRMKIHRVSKKNNHVKKGERTVQADLPVL
ncbi:MAG TPA: hypothetical protein VGO58_12580 [Chitinophagaceae bacterium]|jgi:hypothetical protein|nr:hypothetical protein [Chitinophagaceae bacterium]